MTPPTNPSGQVHPPAAPSGPSAAAADAILAFDPARCVPCRFNRPFDIKDVLDKLVPSIRAEGQLQPGVVCDLPDRPGWVEVLIGHRRVEASRVIGIPFHARKLPAIPSDEEKIRFILTENLNREGMTWLEIAERVHQFIEVSGCKQGEAAERLCLGDPSLVSKALTVGNNLCPPLRPLVESGELSRTTSYLIATVPHACIGLDPLPPTCPQRDLTKLVIEHGLKRDAVAKRVREMKGRALRKPKALAITCGGVTARVSGNPVETLRAFVAKAGEALRRLEKDSLPPDLLPALLK